MNNFAHTGTAANTGAVAANPAALAGAASLTVGFAAVATMLVTDTSLVLPTIALVSTLLAAGAGLVAYSVKPQRRGQWITAAGVFALAAITASIIGDPAAVLAIGK